MLPKPRSLPGTCHGRARVEFQDSMQRCLLPGYSLTNQLLILNLSWYSQDKLCRIQSYNCSKMYKATPSNVQPFATVMFNESLGHPPCERLFHNDTGKARDALELCMVVASPNNWQGVGIEEREQVTSSHILSTEQFTNMTI